MSAEREPKFSRSGWSPSAGTESEPGVPPWEAADRDTDLAVTPLGSWQSIGVRSVDDRCPEKLCNRVRFGVLCEFLTVENNLAAGTETFLPFLTHEQATDVHIFTEFIELTTSLLTLLINMISNLSLTVRRQLRSSWRGAVVRHDVSMTHTAQDLSHR